MDGPGSGACEKGEWRGTYAAMIEDQGPNGYQSPSIRARLMLQEPGLSGNFPLATPRGFGRMRVCEVQAMSKGLSDLAAAHGSSMACASQLIPCQRSRWPDPRVSHE